jgi:hypothetical protein
MIAARDRVDGELFHLGEGIVVGEALGEVDRVQFRAEDGGAADYGFAHGEAFNGHLEFRLLSALLVNAAGLVELAHYVIALLAISSRGPLRPSCVACQPNR